MSAPCPHPSLLEARRASHFPLRKGQSERPAEAHPGETEGAAPPARSGTQANPGLQEAHWLTCLCAYLHSFIFIHSFTQQTVPQHLRGARPCAGCWSPGSQGAYGTWGADCIKQIIPPVGA